MANLVFLTCPNLQILSKTQTKLIRISDLQISGQSLIKGNCHNSRTCNDIDMKLGPVTKLDKRNKTALKKIDDDVMQKIVTSLSFFEFTANLKQPRG